MDAFPHAGHRSRRHQCKKFANDGRSLFTDFSVAQLTKARKIPKSSAVRVQWGPYRRRSGGYSCAVGVYRQLGQVPIASLNLILEAPCAIDGVTNRRPRVRPEPFMAGIHIRCDPGFFVSARIGWTLYRSRCLRSRHQANPFQTHSIRAVSTFFAFRSVA